MAPAWEDTVANREEAREVGFIGNNETIDDHKATPVSEVPIVDVHRSAVEATEEGGTPVVGDVPPAPADPAPEATNEPGVGGPAANTVNVDDGTGFQTHGSDDNRSDNNGSDDNN